MTDKTIRLYTCSHCGKQDQWSPTWSAYYEVPKAKNKIYLDPEVKYVVCSDQCKEALDDSKNMLDEG